MERLEGIPQENPELQVPMSEIPWEEVKPSQSTEDKIPNNGKYNS